ncbi:hypothetical protein CYFUS_008425 [Cystobacter fuscus]|uniref:VOC domain-containing protein n=1 Tax=Cystobacter fuscus TaxID=43 RepID=A0A250JIG6_9BACT|nr:hypothetical protein [Cystobacter fuscus]ATB42946.1 hypothetical protein CYFUS_008425 [Cystobacter fuscus]
MIFHISIAAKDPKRVASVIAELWRGESIEFLPAGNGSWIALAPDERNTAIEVYPLGNLLSFKTPSSVTADPNSAGAGLSATHVALATHMSSDEVFAIGAREGWFTRPMYRKMGFRVIELWVEDRVVLEVLPPDMQAEYLETTKIPRWHEAMDRHKASQAQVAEVK